MYESATLTQEENMEMRGRLQQLLDSEEHPSLLKIARGARIGPTLLYSFMKGRHGLSRQTAKKLVPHMDKYTKAAPSPARKLKAKLTRHAANGHANGQSNGHANDGAARADHHASLIELSQKVIEKLSELRNDSHDIGVCARIDGLFARLGTEGLEILAGAVAPGR